MKNYVNYSLNGPITSKSNINSIDAKIQAENELFNRRANIAKVLAETGIITVDDNKYLSLFFRNK